MGMTRSADYYSPLPGCERIASTDRSARSTANRSTTFDSRSSHSPTSSSASASTSPSSIGSPSALLSPSAPLSVSSSSSSSSSSFLRHRQEGGGGGRLLLDPLLPLHGGETKRAELPEVVLTEVAQLVGHPNTARVLLHNTNKSSYTHLPLPSLSTAPFSTAAYSTGNSTVSTGFTAEHLPASSSVSTSTSASVASSIMNGRLGDDEIRQCKSNSHSGGINSRPTHLVSLSSSGTELHHVGMRHSSHIPLPLSRTPSPLEEREGSAKFGLSDSYSPDCSPPGSPNLNQNRRLSEPCSSLSPLPSPRTSQNMSLSRSTTIDLTAAEESNENEESKKRSTHSIGFICNNNNMDISSDSDSSPSMGTKNNNNNQTNNRSAAPQSHENSRGGYFLTVISGGSLPGETETRQTIRVGSGPWKVAVVPVCPIARARLLRRRALLAARFGNTGGTSSPPSAEPQEREGGAEHHNSRSMPQKQQQIQSHHHHHRHYHHYHNQSSHHPQCQNLHDALRQHHQHQQQHQQHQQQQHQNVQRSPMAKRSSLSQVQSLRLPSRHNSGVPPVVQNIKSLSRSREIELKKSLLHQQQQQQRQRLGQSGTLEVLANAVTDLHMHESKLS